jgi:HTH-type transcriptional regulator/antitoxin HipB
MLGALIREARLQRGWTQAELGRRIGRTQTVISTLERGAYTPRRPATLARLAEALGVPLAALEAAARRQRG